MEKSDKKFLVGVYALAVLIVVVDQLVKSWVRSSIGYGPNWQISSWFYICFVENNGMAFGLEFFDKAFLTIFRILAVGLFAYLLFYLVKHHFSKGFVLAFSLIMAGAAGNTVDCVFYDVLYGNGKWLYGRVVDMFFFPIIRSTWPDWFPVWGGKSLVFFRPVFNVADAAITCSVFYSLIFKGKELSRLFSSNDDDASKSEAK